MLSPILGLLSPILGLIQHWARYGRVVQELSCLSDRPYR